MIKPHRCISIKRQLRFVLNVMTFWFADTNRINNCFSVVDETCLYVQLTVYLHALLQFIYQARTHGGLWGIAPPSKFVLCPKNLTNTILTPIILRCA